MDFPGPPDPYHPPATSVPPKELFFRALPLVAGICSVASLINRFTDSPWYLNVPSIAVSVVGLSAAYLHYRQRPAGLRPSPLVLRLLYIWVVAQAPSLVRIDPTGETPLWETGQVLKFSLGFVLGLHGGSQLQIYYNLVHMFWGWWLYRLRRLRPIA